MRGEWSELGRGIEAFEAEFVVRSSEDRGGRVSLNTVSLSKCLTLNGSPSNFDVRFFA